MKCNLSFSGTAYLEIPANEKFRKLVFDGINLYGTNFGASRNNSDTPDIFEKAEAEAAKRSGAEDAIVVSSGYLAAQLVVQYYLDGHKLIYAPDTHPALWIGKPNPPKEKFNEWIVKTVREVNNTDEPVFLITNSLNNLVPEIYKFDWLNQLRTEKKVTVLIDDSHGLGITGDNGEGIYSRLPELPHVEVIVIASMAKGLGIDAGLVLSKRKIADKLRSSPVYAGASPPSPANLYAYLNADEIYAEELEKLKFNIKFFNSLIDGRPGVTYVDDFPVYLIHESLPSGHLLANGIKISSFAYPDPKGKALNRVVLNSGHTEEDMKKLAMTLFENE